MVYINNNKMYDISTYIIGKFEVLRINKNEKKM